MFSTSQIYDNNTTDMVIDTNQIFVGTKTEVKLFEGGKVDFKCPLPKEQTTSSNWFRTPINSDTETPLSNLLDNSDTRIYHFR